jgi:hypothetical protein
MTSSNPKVYVVTYIAPARGQDLPLGSCRLHAADCRYLRPTAARPYTGKRRATARERATQQRCKVCG